MSASSRTARIIDILAVTLIVLAGITLLSRRHAHDHDDPEVVTELPRNTMLSLDDVPTLGDSSAPVVIVEFSDYECSYCTRFSRHTFPLVRERLIDTGLVTYAFMHSPIAARHPLSPQLSKAAICAGRQGLFWQAHERLFSASSEAATSAASALSGMGLDEAAHTACLKEPWPEELIARDLRTGARLGVSGTPTFVIGRRSDATGIEWARMVKGAQDFAVINRVVEETAGARAGSVVAADVARLFRSGPLLSLMPVWLLLAVAVHQRWRMHRYRQSPWKGGGFGMFSDIHTSSVTAVLSTRDAEGSVADLRLDAGDWMSRFNAVPTERNLRTWGRQILQGRWRRSGESVLPCQAEHANPPLRVSCVRLTHLVVDFNRRTGSHSAAPAGTIVVGPGEVTE